MSILYVKDLVGWYIQEKAFNGLIFKFYYVFCDTSILEYHYVIDWK